jgi:hypothetical protein
MADLLRKSFDADEAFRFIYYFAIISLSLSVDDA